MVKFKLSKSLKHLYHLWAPCLMWKSLTSYHNNTIFVIIKMILSMVLLLEWHLNYLLWEVSELQCSQLRTNMFMWHIYTERHWRDFQMHDKSLSLICYYEKGILKYIFKLGYIPKEIQIKWMLFLLYNSITNIRVFVILLLQKYMSVNIFLSH